MYKGFSIISSKSFDTIFKVLWKVRMFLIPLFIRFLNAEVLGFFCYEQNLILGSEKSKIQLQKIVGNVLDKP